MKIIINTFAALLLITLLSYQQKQEKEKVNVNAREVKELVAANKNLVILDVRTPQEFAQGHLKGAINIDFLAPEFKEKISMLDTSATYLLYCKSGNRSGKATVVMQENNFKNLYNATVGYEALKTEGVLTDK